MSTIKVGDKLPEVSFKQFTSDGLGDVSTGDVFAGKRVLLFGIPGAFTPVCQGNHLPGYVDQAATFKLHGIDEIACISVNDVFVMGAWAKSQDVGDRVIMLADGNGAFAKAIGLELDGSKFGMGPRSQRYSMVVKDGVVEKLNVEEGGAFEVSSADYMLAQV